MASVSSAAGDSAGRRRVEQAAQAVARSRAPRSAYPPLTAPARRRSVPRCAARRGRRARARPARRRLGGARELPTVSGPDATNSSASTVYGELAQRPSCLRSRQAQSCGPPPTAGPAVTSPARRCASRASRSPCAAGHARGGERATAHAGDVDPHEPPRRRRLALGGRVDVRCGAGPARRRRRCARRGWCRTPPPARRAPRRAVQLEQRPERDRLLGPAEVAGRLLERERAALVEQLAQVVQEPAHGQVAPRQVRQGHGGGGSSSAASASRRAAGSPLPAGVVSVAAGAARAAAANSSGPTSTRRPASHAAAACTRRIRPGAGELGGSEPRVDGSSASSSAGISPAPSARSGRDQHEDPLAAFRSSSCRRRAAPGTRRRSRRSASTSSIPSRSRARAGDRTAPRRRRGRVRRQGRTARPGTRSR